MLNESSRINNAVVFAADVVPPILTPSRVGLANAVTIKRIINIRKARKSIVLVLHV